MGLADVRRDPVRRRDGILAAMGHVRDVEGDAQHVRPDRLDQPHDLEGGDLLVGLHVHVDAEVAGDRGELVQEPLGRLSCSSQVTSVRNRS